MRIVYLASGAGRMYCGSCLHSNTLAAALAKAGQDIALVPLYTPLRTDEENVSVPRVAMGGVNVCLQQKWPVFRRTPRFLARLLDSPRLLRWMGRFSSSTRPETLGELTVSMLRGEEGRQQRELADLIAWLGEDLRPDVVHLSNALLAGLARPIARRLGVPIVCELTGEDSFLERLPQPHYSEARRVLAERVEDITALIALNRYYAEFMAAYLPVPRERICVVRHGLNLEGHAKPALDADFPTPPPDSARRGFTIGYLGRVCHEKGLHLLADALALLAWEKGLPPIRLRAAGYLEPADRGYLDGIQAKLRRLDLAHHFQYLGALDRAGKIAFLQSLDVMSAPTVYPESKGIPVLEAWANGVPVVLPAHGAFPEMLEDTGGGLSFSPGHVAGLAGALKRMIQEPDLAAACSRRGQAAVHQRYHAARMAEEMMAVYKEVCGR